MTIINWNIAKHPLNWIIIGVVGLIVFYALHFVLSYFTQKNAAPASTQPLTGSNFAY